jgi:hypothetical protein
MPKPTLQFFITLAVSTACLHGEARIWTSTSGSTVNADYLGSFGDDLWFERAGADGRLLKMPAKYISAADLDLIETGKVVPQIDPKVIDGDDASRMLLEQLLSTQAPELTSSEQTLESAVNELLEHIPSTDEAGIALRFHRKVDRKVQRAAPIADSTVYEALQLLAEIHAFKWSIHEGGLALRPD